MFAYPDFKEPFDLHTEASTRALGTDLYQTQEGRKSVIDYANKIRTEL